MPPASNTSPAATVSVLASSPVFGEGFASKFGQFIYAAVLFMLFIVLYFYVRDTKIHLGGDNAEYYILAKALAEGKGYNYIASMGDQPHNHFPPGYPFIMSVLMRFFGSDQATLTAFNGVFMLGSVLLLFNLFHRFTQNIHLGFAVAAACLFNYHLMQYSTIMMSEIPFLFFSCLTLWVFLQLKTDENPLRQAYFYIFIALLASSFYIRTAGISLVAGSLFYFAWQRNWKFALAISLGFFLLVLPWQIRSRSLGGNSYVKQLLMVNPYAPEQGALGTIFLDASGKTICRDSILKQPATVTQHTNMQFVADLATRFTNNTKRYISREIPAGIFPWLEHDPKEPTSGSEWLWGSLIFAFILWGIYKIKEHRLLLLGYMLGSFGILLLWPDVWFGARFVLPLLPFLLFAFANGLIESIKFGLQKLNFNSPFLLNALLPFVLMAFIPKWYPEQGGILRDEKGNEYPTFLLSLSRLHNGAEEDYDPKYKNYFACAAWIKDNTPKESVICCRKPGLLYVNADRYVTGFKASTNTDSVVANLVTRKVSYVVLDQLGFSDVGRYLYPAVMANPQKFPIVHQEKDPDTYVLKFVPDAVVDKTPVSATADPSKQGNPAK